MQKSRQVVAQDFDFAVLDNKKALPELKILFLFLKVLFVFKAF